MDSVTDTKFISVECDHNTWPKHLRSPGEKGQTKEIRDLELQIHGST